MPSVKTTASTDREEVMRDAAARLSLIVSIDGKPQAFALPSSGEMSIGRSRDCMIRIDHPVVSGQHALLTVGKQLQLRDLDSTNGTRLQGKRLSPHRPTTLRVGQIFELGHGRILMTLQRRKGPEQSARPAEHPAKPKPQDDSGRHSYLERIEPFLKGAAASHINVLIWGETGVGKEVLAERLHQFSPRALNPFLRLSCAAVPESLAESELFGHERGAFTGSVASKPGLLEGAHGGTVFLDEIGELSPQMQVRLLRVIEQREVLRVGGLKTRCIDVRFLAATNRNLELEIKHGRFRSDLYYRLSGVTFEVPPLRERRHEIPALAQQFIVRACERDGISRVPALSAEALRVLVGWDWPGNIRELANVMGRAVISCRCVNAETIRPEHIVAGPLGPKPISGQPETASTNPGPLAPRSLRSYLRSLELQYVRSALLVCHGNQSEAARMLGISRTTLAKLLSGAAEVDVHPSQSDRT